MNISDILLKFDSGSRKDYYSFETFILNLLKHHIESQGKSFEVIEKSRTPIDAIAREGFDNFEGLTLIDVVPNINTIPERIFERIIRSASELGESEIKYFIIISKRTLKDKVKIFAESFGKLKGINFEIKVFGPEDITTLIEQNREKANQVANNLFSLKLESTISKKDRNWKEEREQKIENLTELYANGQITLFLGAGVSSSAGMPDWNKLLDSGLTPYLSDKMMVINNSDEYSS